MENEGLSEPLQGLLASAAGAGGVAIGATAGYLAGGPEGAAAGGAAGALLQDGFRVTASDIAHRALAEGEKERVGTCLVLAHEEIAKRLNDGKPLRDPRFFQRRQRKANSELRSEAEELLEGTFLSARDAYEEKKIELLAKFYANAAFEESLEFGALNHVLHLIRTLTYRQLVTLGILGLHQKFDTRLNVRDSDFRENADEKHTQLTVGVLYEVFQMASMNLLIDNSGSYILGVADIAPARLKLQGLGANLCNLLELHLLPSTEHEFFFAAFPRLDS